MGNRTSASGVVDAAQAPAPSGMEQAGERYVLRYDSCRYLSYIRAVVSVVTVAAAFAALCHAWGDLLVLLGIYLVLACVLLLLLELSPFINKVAACEGGGCCKVWHVLLWFDTWRRGVLYMLVLVVLLLIMFGASHGTILGVLFGVALFTLAVLYLASPYQYKKQSLYAMDAGQGAASRPAGSQSTVSTMSSPHVP